MRWTASDVSTLFVDMIAMSYRGHEETVSMLKRGLDERERVVKSEVIFKIVKQVTVLTVKLLLRSFRLSLREKVMHVRSS